MPTKHGTITLEELESVLSHDLVNAYLGDPSAECLQRRKVFEVDGARYVAEWWINVCYLYLPVGGTVVFHSVKVSGTWPNRAKTNLQFYAYGQTVFILPIEQYEQEAGK